jgi:pimeloyl-ACP methyl ester carboxylesterase
MKRQMASMVRALVILLLLALAGCAVPGQQTGTTTGTTTAPADALTYEQLLAALDTLQGPATQSGVPGRSVFALPGGKQLSTQDLSTYLNAVKQGIAAFVSARTGGRPYLVVPVKLTWTPSNSGRANSGLMWVPFSLFKSLSVPIISYQHGTQVYRGSAPSRFNPNPLSILSSPDQSGALQAYVEDIVGALMAAAGYIVVMPDYPGFGDSTEPHPYVTMALGTSVKDALAAAARALTGRVTSNGKIFLTGYSEGGYATMAGARALQGARVSVAAVVPGDGPYDLSGVMLDQMRNGANVKEPAYLLYTTFGYNAVYGDTAINYAALLQPTFAAYITGGLFDGTHTNAQVQALELPTTPSQMLTDAAISTLLAPGGSVTGLLADNDGWVGWTPTGPVVMVHCPTDDIVPYQNALNAKAAFTQEGFGALVRVVDVQPVPLIATALGSIHVAAYPSAMLAAFTAIETVNKGF